MSEKLFSARSIVELLEAQNGKLVGNVSCEAVGHLFAELNNHICKQVLGEAPDFAIYLGPDNERTNALKDLYGPTLPINFVLSSMGEEMERAISLFRPDLVEDAGISSYKFAPIEGRTVGQRETKDGYLLYIVEPTTIAQDTAELYRRKRETRPLFSLARKFEMPSELENFIAAHGRKMALISHKKIGGKDFVGSGAAKSFNPRNYLSTLEHLKDEGYQLVHFGREQYPEIYRAFDVIDYANSSLASFRNDLILASHADFGLFGSSGISWFAEWMDMPFVMVNMWTIDSPPFSDKAVYVPTLAKDLTSGDMVGYEKQLWFRQEHGVFFPHSVYEATDCSPEDILAATRECLEMERQDDVPFTENQRRYQATVSAHPTPKQALSRISAAFADKHADLMTVQPASDDQDALPLRRAAASA
jgi:putative glycosyltransferase (TIGR04372 family)